MRAARNVFEEHYSNITKLSKRFEMRNISSMNESALRRCHETIVAEAFVTLVDNA